VVTRENVVGWLAARRGWRHLDDRVTDLGWVFLVNGQPDEVLDGTAELDRTAGPILVVKRNGGVWELPWSQNLLSAIGAPDEATFNRLMWDAGRPVNLDLAKDWVTTRQSDLTALIGKEQVATWIRNTTGYRHVEDRIGDMGWAFMVSTQPDAYHDGNEYAMTYGNGPQVIVKRTGAVWPLSSEPSMVPAFSAQSEEAFYQILRDVTPNFNEEQPPMWIAW